MSHLNLYVCACVQGFISIDLYVNRCYIGSSELYPLFTHVASENVYLMVGNSHIFNIYVTLFMHLSFCCASTLVMTNDQPKASGYQIYLHVVKNIVEPIG